MKKILFYTVLVAFAPALLIGALGLYLLDKLDGPHMGEEFEDSI